MLDCFNSVQDVTVCVDTNVINNHSEVVNSANENTNEQDNDALMNLMELMSLSKETDDLDINQGLQTPLDITPDDLRRHEVSRNSHSTVVNISDYVLTDAQLSVLEKGLNFCPTPGEPDLGPLKQDLDKFHAGLRRKTFFDNQGTTIRPNTSSTSDLACPPDYPDHIDRGPREQSTFEHPKFKNKSKWVPPMGPHTLETYMTVNEHRLSEFVPREPRVKNISKAEKEGLRDLQNNTNIVIKPADKGSATVIMNVSDYIAEADKQLSDSRFYTTLDRDPTDTHQEIVKKAVTSLKYKGEISQKTMDYLIIDKPRLSRLYLLPKIHKNQTPPPGRPIVSANECPTERISGFVDHFLRPIVMSTPSYIKDTTDFIQKISTIQELPDETLLLTLDVSSLYTNIPNDEGIRACLLELSKHRPPDAFPTVQSLIWLLKLTLRLNNFEFNGNHYLQIGGTAMGTRLAPSYANIFMSELEQKLIEDHHLKPHTWFRFIDDIFCIWTHGAEKLDDFIKHLNESHQTIKFTTEISDTKVNFLDTTVYLDQRGGLYTNLYTKPTDTHNYLHYTSAHPAHCMRGGPYSQLLRVKRICTHEADFVENSKMILSHFYRRGYPEKLLLDSYNRAKILDRQTLLLPKDTSETKEYNNSQLFMISTYNPSNPPLRTMLTDHWDLLNLKTETFSIHKSKLIVGSRRNKNLRDVLVKARLPTGPTQNPSVDYCNPCTKADCKYCKMLIVKDQCVSFHTQRSYSTPTRGTCKSNNLIYLIDCTACGRQYVGETKRRVQDRLSEHLRDIKKLKSHLKGEIQLLKDTPVSKHFNLPLHSIANVQIQIIEFMKHNKERESTTQLRRRKEFHWIHQLKTLDPWGMNKMG